jgi:hypothetical protein
VGDDSDKNRRVKWADIPDILELNCGEKAVRAAFKKEGFVRRIARKKLSLSEKNRKDRLAWAWEHLFWSDEQCDLVLWSDETWVQPRKHKKTWITRRIGEVELYNDDCGEDRY